MGQVGKKLVWGVIALVALGGLLWLLWPEPVPVDVAEVQRGPMEVTVNEEGRTRVRDRYEVSSPLSGRLHRIAFEPGDPVEAGDVLAWIDPPAPDLLDRRTRAIRQAQVQAAQAAVERARVQIEQLAEQRDLARRQYKRLREVFRTDAGVEQEVDLAESRVRVQEQQWEMAQHDLRMAEQELAQAQAALAVTAYNDGGDGPDPLAIHAPVGGRVLRVHQKSEAFVVSGTRLLEMGDPNRLEIVADILTEEATRIEPGAPVHLERWSGEETLRGRVRHVEPGGFTKISALGVEEQRVNVVIDFDASPEAYERLGDAYRMDVRIVIWQNDETLRVPTGALFRQDDRWMVFKVDQGRAVQQPVEIGRQAELYAQVLDGLEPGDRVVMYPGDRIEDGVRISPRR